MSGTKRVGRYPVEVRERAVRMVREHQHQYRSQWKAIESISAKLSINHETLRNWVRKAETDAGTRPGSPPMNEPRCVSLSERSKSCVERMRF